MDNESPQNAVVWQKKTAPEMGAVFLLLTVL